MSSSKIKKGPGKSKRKEDILASYISTRTGLDWMDGVGELYPENMPPLRVLVKRPTASKLPPYYRKLPVEQVKRLEKLVESNVLTRTELARYWPWNFDPNGLVREGREWRLSAPSHLHPRGTEVVTFESCGKPMKAFFDIASKKRSVTREIEALLRNSRPQDLTDSGRALFQTVMATNSFNRAQPQHGQDLPSDRELLNGLTKDHAGCVAEMYRLRAKLFERERQLEAANERIATLEDYNKDLEMITEARVGTETCDTWEQVMRDALRK